MFVTAAQLNLLLTAATIYKVPFNAPKRAGVMTVDLIGRQLALESIHAVEAKGHWGYGYDAIHKRTESALLRFECEWTQDDWTDYDVLKTCDEYDILCSESYSWWTSQAREYVDTIRIAARLRLGKLEDPTYGRQPEYTGLPWRPEVTKQTA